MKIAPDFRRRAGISDLVAAVITVAITLIAGGALFGYVNGQAAVNERQLGVANAANVNFLNERFVVPQITFKYTSPTNQITLYVYNNGQLSDAFVEVELYNSTRSKMDLVYYYCSTTTPQTSTLCKLPNPPSTLLSGNRVLDLNNRNNNNCYADATSLESPTVNSYQVPIGGISSITITLPSLSAPCVNGAFTVGTFYYVQLLGQYGNTVTYFQAM